jgi:hypothetical protein
MKRERSSLLSIFDNEITVTRQRTDKAPTGSPKHIGAIYHDRITLPATLAQADNAVPRLCNSDQTLKTFCHQLLKRLEERDTEFKALKTDFNTLYAEYARLKMIHEFPSGSVTTSSESTSPPQDDAPLGDVYDSLLNISSAPTPSEDSSGDSLHMQVATKRPFDGLSPAPSAPGSVDFTSEQQDLFAFLLG